MLDNKGYRYTLRICNANCFSNCAGDKIENEMGGTCSVHGGMGESCTGLWWGNLKERDHRGDPGVDGRILVMRIFRKWDVGVWTGLSWFRMNLRVP
jgi:hypothetical protein